MWIQPDIENVEYVEERAEELHFWDFIGEIHVKEDSGRVIRQIVTMFAE